MNPPEQDQLARIGRAFQIPGTFLEARRMEGGHIHDTFAATYLDRGQPFRVVHQRLNTRVFRDPDGLMRNIVRVTDHVRRRLEARNATEIPRRVLQVVPTRTGEPSHRDDRGDPWRTFLHIERVRSPRSAETPAEAYQAGRAFGEFQSLLADLPADALTTTIPDFHHTPKRYVRLEAAIAADACQRVARAAPEIAFARGMASLAGALLDAQARGDAPTRVTHNDTKFGNVLLDDQTGEALCVVDLDTVMPGTVLFDFGDMVRTTATRAAEDEPDLDQVHLEMPMFEALLRGYLDASRTFLTAGERRHLVVAGRVITLTMGVRFLTDYLEGDRYYRVGHPEHNLDRCRTQFRLLTSMTGQREAMEHLLATAWAEVPR